MNRAAEDWNMSKSKKAGVMFVEDIYGDWSPGFFAITGSTLLCTEIDASETDSSSDDDWVLTSVLTNLHFFMHSTCNRNSTKESLCAARAASKTKFTI